jgi:hypothetical protein
VVLLDAGAFRDAARAFEGAVRLYALHLGDAHPRVGRARHSLGLAQDARGRPASAALDIEQALATFEETHDLPGAAAALNSLALVRRKEGRSAPAPTARRCRGWGGRWFHARCAQGFCAQARYSNGAGRRAGGRRRCSSTARPLRTSAAQGGQLRTKTASPRP